MKDKRGALIPNLPKNDFQLLEDGKPQNIKYFSVNSDLPLTLGILIDASGSQQNVLDMEKQVGGAFLTDIIREKDLAFVLSFDVNVDLLQDFTSSTRKLKDALNSARINTGGGGGTIGGLGGGPIPTSGAPKGTLLYDAIYLAAHDELAQQVGRKAMIILTDGEDQGSRLRVQDAIEAAQKSDSIVYVLMIADREFHGGGFYHGDSEMKKLSRETGGRVIDVGDKFDKLKDAFDQIALELRSQYSSAIPQPIRSVTAVSARLKFTIRTTKFRRVPDTTPAHRSRETQRFLLSERWLRKFPHPVEGRLQPP